MNEKKKKTIPLRKAVPVYIKYFTCEINKINTINKQEKKDYKGPQKELDDKLFFYLDVYGYDEKMIKEIYK